jgi:hypothetical protein
MNAERIVRIVAGGFVLLSLALGVAASPLFQSGFTKFCPLNNILAKIGVKGGSC